MSTRRQLSGAFAIALIVLGLAPVASTLAQTSGEVIATGLSSPRGLSMGSDGNLYVAEAGSGGDQSIMVELMGAQTEVRYGNTGRVTRISADGTQSIVARNLPSFSTPTEAAGPHGVIYANGALWVTTMGTLLGPLPLQNPGSLLRVDPQSGAVQNVASFQEYEKTNNPGGFIQDSNPYGLALGRDGMVYVADAGGNVLYMVNPANGQISVAARFAGLPLPEPLRGQGGPFDQGNPERGGALETDPVPAGVTVGPDGSIYVSLLSGFPFLEGGAKVQRVGSGGSLTDAATGLTMAVDVEAGPDGSLYVSEFARFSLTTQPPGFVPNSGRVLRIAPDGTKQVIAEGLDTPNGIALGSNGEVYVVVNSLSPTDGQVIRLSGMVGGGVGMPRTGDASSMEQALYVSLLSILLGCALLLTSRKAVARRTVE